MVMPKPLPAKPIWPDAYLDGHNKLVNYLNLIFQSNKTIRGQQAHTYTHIRNTFAVCDICDTFYTAYVHRIVGNGTQSISVNRFNAITHDLCYLSHIHGVCRSECVALNHVCQPPIQLCARNTQESHFGVLQLSIAALYGCVRVCMGFSNVTWQTKSLFRACNPLCIALGRVRAFVRSISAVHIALR